jgi:hypothetical protein
MLTAYKTAEGSVEVDSETARVTRSAETDATARKTELRTTPAILELLLRIEGEYREMPGLSLTMSQAERLWGLDRRTCRVALTKLIERRVLRRASNGTYVRGPFG